MKEASETCRDRDNVILFYDGSRIMARDVRLTPDSVFWMQEVGGQQGARLRDVDRITNRQYLRGALDGAAAAFGAGCMLGLLPAVFFHSQPDAPPVLAVSFFCGTLLAPFGAMGGAAVGHRTIIEYDSSAPPPEDLPRPPVRNAKGWAMPEGQPIPHP